VGFASFKVCTCVAHHPSCCYWRAPILNAALSPGEKLIAPPSSSHPTERQFLNRQSISVLGSSAGITLRQDCESINTPPRPPFGSACAGRLWWGDRRSGSPTAHLVGIWRLTCRGPPRRLAMHRQASCRPIRVNQVKEPPRRVNAQIAHGLDERVLKMSSTMASSRPERRER